MELYGDMAHQSLAGRSPKANGEPLKLGSRPGSYRHKFPACITDGMLHVLAGMAIHAISGRRGRKTFILVKAKCSYFQRPWGGAAKGFLRSSEWWLGARSEPPMK